ncbi:hypothetical protein ACLMJU_13295 [Bacillus paranthracis]|uniref:hypothetical protein n=1 Tax=Bacillus cereus group TaxID=86661 RepID=UPI001F57FBDC|nr:hypothetical protein [Bacillus cereus group sp. BfR-BA-01511]
MGQSVISILRTDTSDVSLRSAMKDLNKLSGVISELGQSEYFNDPLKTYEFLILLNILNEEALGLTSSIEDVRTLKFRYRNMYGGDPVINLEHFINVLDKYGWISKGKSKVTMMDVGKRMINVLIRLANDSLAYYLQDDVTRSLYQANRDADLSEAYDDKGVSGGNKLASMIKNIEEAVEKLKERELEYLADRYALPQVKIINNLMSELNVRFEDRFKKFETFEESLVLQPLIKRGTSVIVEGSAVSSGTIQKILRFTHIQESAMGIEIRHDLLRCFIENCFTKQDIEQPDVHEILSFMEQGRRESERMDGLWIPVQFAAPLSSVAISNGIQFLEDYEPYTDYIEEVVQEEYEDIEEISEEEVRVLLADQQWSMTKEQIQTEKLEDFLFEQEEVDMEELVLEVGSNKWGDAVNVLIALSALTANNKAEILDNQNVKELNIEKEWEWGNKDDKCKRVRSRKQN